MSEPEQAESERYFRAYQRGALVCLVSAVAVGAYFLAMVLGVLSDPQARVGALILIALFGASLLAVLVITLRGRAWRGRDPGARLVLRDEWTRTNRNRAFRSGFAVVMWAQVPLAFVMHRLATEPSFAGMAGLSMALGIGAFFATYLHVGRPLADG